MRLWPQIRIVWVLPVIAEWFSAVAAGQAVPAVPVPTIASVIWNEKAMIVRPTPSAGAGLRVLGLSKLLLAETLTMNVPVRSVLPAAVVARRTKSSLAVPGWMSSAVPDSLR